MKQDDDHAPPFDGLSRRLWTPWRMTYVGGDAKETGCLFCNRIAADDDVASLILHRSANSVVIMNLYPYNTGHLMVVPNQHVASPEDADPDVLANMAKLLPPVLRALRRVLDCHGFNVGFNIGSVAGAGVADHLHQHVVPRWNGDANFMPIIGAAMIIPELIPVSYAKIRAELQREFAPGEARSVRAVVVEPRSSQILLEADGSLPEIGIEDGRSIWRQLVDYFAGRGVDAGIAGWAGTNSAGVIDQPALTLFASETSLNSENWNALGAPEAVDESVKLSVTRGLSQLSPIVTSGQIPI